MTGWFAVKRGITEHCLFKGRPERLAAWIWMLDQAAWKDTRQDIGGEIVVIRRGEFCASQAMMERGTGLSRKQLRTFLEVLKSEGAVRTRSGKKGAKSRAIVTICNYAKYQDVGPSRGQRGAKEGPIKEQGNNSVTNVTGGNPPDPVKLLWDSGVALLTSAGVPDGKARSLIGKWRKDHGDEALLTAIGKAKREGAVNPVEFIPGCFRFQAKQAQPVIGQTRQNSRGVTEEYHGPVDGWMEVHA